MPRMPSLQTIQRLKAKLESDVDVIAFIGWPLTGSVYHDFVETVHNVLPDGIDVTTVSKSLIDLLGKELSEELLQPVAWRLAGNVRRLRDGIPATVWTRQQVDEWVPLLVKEVKLTHSRLGKPEAELITKAVAGSPASMPISLTWSRKFCHARSRHVGFTPGWGKLPYRHPYEFVGLRLTGMVSAEESNGHPVVSKVLDDEPSSVVNYNRRIISARLRRPESGFTCPKEYEHPCHLCPIGYDDCPVGTHPNTFVMRYCTTCKQDNWSDPGRRGKVCVDCAARPTKTDASE